MIVFDLQCDCGCQFEGWFRDHNEFADQQKSGQLVCPDCGSNQSVRKILSPVAYQKMSSLVQEKESFELKPRGVDTEDFIDSAYNFLTVLSDYVEKNYEDVGSDFAKETLKIHYGAEKERKIRGVVTAAEEKMLKDEEIMFLKIPMFVKEDGKKQ